MLLKFKEAQKKEEERGGEEERKRKGRINEGAKGILTCNFPYYLAVLRAAIKIYFSFCY